MQLKYALIPELKMMNNFRRFRRIQRQYFADDMAGYAEYQALLAIAFGDFREAAEWLANDRGRYSHNCLDEHLPGLADRLAGQGDDLTMEDKRALIDVLHQREAAAVKALKLEKYWQKTPFPAEEDGLV